MHWYFYVPKREREREREKEREREERRDERGETRDERRDIIIIYVPLAYILHLLDSCGFS